MLRDRFHVWGERKGRGGHGFRVSPGSRPAARWERRGRKQT